MISTNPVSGRITVQSVSPCYFGKTEIWPPFQLKTLNWNIQGQWIWFRKTLRRWGGVGNFARDRLRNATAVLHRSHLQLPGLWLGDHIVHVELDITHKSFWNWFFCAIIGDPGFQTVLRFIRGKRLVTRGRQMYAYTAKAYSSNNKQKSSTITRLIFDT